jgi:hypothetical protein
VRYSLLLGIAPDDPEQSKRFIETAKEVGADDDALGDMAQAG